MMQGDSKAGPEHQQKVLVLDGGLDLVTPKLLVEPGRLVDCLNYECADQVGYKKIDGFERYDGGLSPSVSGIWGVFTTTLAAAPAPAFSAGDVVTFTYTIDTKTYVSTSLSVHSVATSGGRWVLYFHPPYFSTILLATAGSFTNTSGGTATALTTAGFVVSTQTDSLSADLAATEVERLAVDPLPGDVFPYGLQMYDNRMHAVADCQYIYLVYDHTISPTPVSSLAEFYVGNVFRNGASGREGVILDYKFLFGGFGDLSSAGTKVTSAVAQVLVRFTNTAALTDDTVLNIDRKFTTYADPSPVTYWKYLAALTGTGASLPLDVWGGVLYRGLVDGSPRTDDSAWEAISMGYEVAFKDGTSTIDPRELTLATTTAQLDNDIQTSIGTPSLVDTDYSNTFKAYQDSCLNAPAIPTTGWDTTTPTPDNVGSIDGLSFSYDLETSDDTGIYITKYSGNQGWTPGNVEVSFKGLGIEVPDDCIITGISVRAKCWRQSLVGVGIPDLYFTRVGFETNEGDVSVNAANSTDVLTVAAHGSAVNAKTYNWGNAQDKWGLRELTPEVVNHPDFKLVLNPANTANSVLEYLLFDQLYVTVHYYRPVGTLYFYDAGASVPSQVEARLIRVHLSKGSWAAGDAEGILHIDAPVNNSVRNMVRVGDTIRLVSGSGNIGTVTSVTSSFLPSHTAQIASDARVQMLTANYYLNPDWDTIYGVNGLGRAFSYDGVYFRKIYSAYDSELDKPRHVASYRNYLALGYTSGNVLLSKYGESGPEPENFIPLQGAREFSFSDKVTGLIELADTSLGVFCRSSIQRIVLNPNAAEASGLFYTAVIAADSGALEYTVATFGNMTLYCDQYGIRSVEQTDLLGGFIGRPLSNVISPWLRPRLSAKKYWTNSRRAQLPVFAHSVRAKNQYRIWFTDGYVLCMNMNSTEDPPRFTLLQYGMDFGDDFVPLLPVAFTSSVDPTGTERMHVAHWDRDSTAAGAENSSTLFKYVFEMEKGWSFDGQDFPARLTINLSFLENPFDYDQIRKIELHAADYNNTTLFAGFGTKYGEEESYTGMSLGSTYVPAGRTTSGAVSLDYVPFSKMINVSSRGRPLYLKFKNSSTATGDTSASAIEPPHILQALLIQYTPARQET